MNQIIWTLLKKPTEPWLEKCREGGIAFYHLPLIRIKDLGRPTVPMKSLSAYDGVILTSRHGADSFMKWADGSGNQAETSIFSVGKAAQETLNAAGLKATMVADQTESILPSDDWLKERGDYLHPCSRRTPPDTWVSLKKAGIMVEALPLYEPVTWFQEELIPLIHKPRNTIIAFGSPSGMDAFVEHFPNHDEALHCLKENTIAVIGSTTGATLKKVDIEDYIQPHVPQADSLIKIILNHFKKLEYTNELIG
ncbi:uroporphyrinogen-III synthase [Caldithrix abyssi]|nr:uroporphyrinogen-III synthase [Caldithrix abyssi]